MKHNTTHKPLCGRLSRVFLAGMLALILHSGYTQNIAINSTGNTADASSMLDINATNKGLLIPRVALTATNVAGPITSPATSLIVYNTATAGSAPNNVVPGYYYWTGTQWAQFISSLNMTNIYNSSGSLTSNRTVNLNGKTLRFQDNTQAFGGQTLFTYNNGASLVQSTTTGRSELALHTGGSSLFLFQDLNNMAQLTTGGTSTGLTIGTPMGNATPVHCVTNGTIRMIISPTGEVAIGDGNPSHLLHVMGDGVNSPLRLENLLASGSTTAGTLVADADGVVSRRDANSISAVRVMGSVTLAANNTSYSTDQTATPTETFDNLNEFSGNTFTAAATGLYQVTLKVNYDQRSSASDGGDGYLAFAYIDAGTLPGPPTLSGSSQKINFSEASGSPSTSSVTNSEIVKLTAGQGLRFRVLTYGSSGNVTANYVITINRID